MQTDRTPNGEENNMTLIALEEVVDNYQDRFEVIEEQIDGKPRKFLEGIFAQAEIVNGNQRVYQKKEMISEMERFNKEMIPTRKALGELDHSTESQVLLHRASHIFESPMSMDGNNLIAKARVLDTAHGQTVGVLIDEKIPFGVSSKGMGELSPFRKDGKSVKLVSKFTMRSPGDIVYSQSAPDAVPKVIIEMIMENERRIEEIWGLEVLDPIRKRIAKINKLELSEQFKTEFEKLIRHRS